MQPPERVKNVKDKAPGMRATETYSGTSMVRGFSLGQMQAPERVKKVKIEARISPAIESYLEYDD